MADSNWAQTIAEVRDRVQIEWAALEYVVAGLSAEELTAPGTETWSVKDHLAHIGEWDSALTAVLGGQPDRVGFRLDAETAATLDTIDKLNDVLFQRSRNLSVEDVQANARRAHAELLEALAKLHDADLDKTVADVGADPTDQHQLSQRIAVDSYAHYAEHVGWIKTLLANL